MSSTITENSRKTQIFLDRFANNGSFFMVLSVKISIYYRRKQKAFLPEADFPTQMLVGNFGA